LSKRQAISLFERAWTLRGMTTLLMDMPEVMDVFDMLRRYHGRLAFHGGLSIQKVLPFGTEQDVRGATQKLIDAGRHGGYVLSPSHDVPRDVPPRNLVAMMDILKSQPGFSG